MVRGHKPSYPHAPSHGPLMHPHAPSHAPSCTLGVSRGVRVRREGVRVRREGVRVRMVTGQDRDMRGRGRGVRSGGSHDQEGHMIRRVAGPGSHGQGHPQAPLFPYLCIVQDIRRANQEISIFVCWFLLGQEGGQARRRVTGLQEGHRVAGGSQGQGHRIRVAWSELHGQSCRPSRS
jgi:hypothetical protein